MKRLTKLAPFVVLAVCCAAVSWAGGSTCTHDDASSSSAATTAGSHCSGKGASASADGKCPMQGASAAGQTCSVKSNQVMYSFSVPSVECGHCVSAIQTVAMDTKGITCAHVDLSTHTAYIIAEKNVSQKQVSKMITTAGFKNKYTGEGSKAESAFAKATVSGDKGMSCCSKGKDKV